MNSVGQLAWARRTGGRLAWNDRLALNAQALRPQWVRTTDRWKRALHLSGVPNALPWSELSDIRMPDTSLARQALDCATELSPPWVLNHCMRSWLWGELLARRQGVTFDREVFFVATVLHDLGLTPTHDGHHPNCHCFAVEGAEAAHRFVLAAGAGSELADTVYQAISLHLNPRVPLARGKAAHFLNAGAALDVVGAGMRALPSAVVASVIEKHPWLEFDQCMVAAMQQQAARRPDSRAAFLVAHGFDRLILEVRR